MFTKKDLKTGMVVETRGGYRYMVITGNVPTPSPYGTSNGVFISTDDWNSFDEYDDNLISKHSDLTIDIVYESDIFGLDDMLTEPNDVIWKRDEEELIDWSTVPVDTTILVRDYEDEDWIPAYFAEYNNGVVYVWEDGGTSFTKKQTEAWCYAKLYEEDK